jgi:hypothetical protein
VTSPLLWSFGGPSRSPNEPTLADALKAIWRWWRPVPKTLREQTTEARLVDALAEEIDAEAETPALPAPPRSKRRPRA